MGIGLIAAFYFLKNERDEFYDRDIEPYEDMFKPYEKQMEEYYQSFTEWDKKTFIKRQ